MKNATIAIAMLAAITLALASAPAAAQAKRGPGMATTGQGGGPGAQPGGRANKSKATAKQRMQSRPFCPYGKKADGTCWVRCSQPICL